LREGSHFETQAHREGARGASKGRPLLAPWAPFTASSAFQIECGQNTARRVTPQGMSTPGSLIRREFLGWDRPALPAAARLLQTRYRRGHTLDLGRVIIVVPGQRAGRRLQELLAFSAEDDNLRLTPPEVVTESLLPEKLYTPKLPFASDIVQDLAWTQSLRSLPAELRQHVVPHPPDSVDGPRWLELGAVLRNLHRELAADGLDFGAVEKNGPNLAGFNESKRWAALAEVQRRYLSLLDRQKLWDKQTARLKAVEYREIAADCDIVLLGTVDLNATLRLMLEQIAKQVTAFMVAPVQLADRFDVHGCLVASAWFNAPIPLGDKHLRQVDGPQEQAGTVLDWLRDLGGRFRSDEIAIGVPDESLVPQLQRELEQSGVSARWVEGRRLGETGPYRLLAAAVRFADRRHYDDLATLVRHPDLEDWLQRTLSHSCDNGAVLAPSLPAQLDRYCNRHLPSRIRAGPHLANARHWPTLAVAVERIEAWLEEASVRHPLRSWGEVFRKMLGTVYGGKTLELDNPGDEVLHRTFGGILDACDTLAAIPDALDAAAWSATDAFQVALGPLATKTVPPPADAGAIEILGWLELPLDDSRALIVTSFNEGFVPKSTGTDAFLPDRLRKELALLHDEQRYARDAYATSVLCQSREALRVLLARRDAQNDPLQPSRLVFACPDEALIRRAQLFFGGLQVPVADRRLLLASSGPIPDKSLFRVPPARKSGAKLDRISVTRFKAYLSCPYRYYLRHVEKLEAVNDAVRELDGGAFGTLLHQVLGTFGRDADGPRHSDRHEEIFEFLADHFSTLAAGLYGPGQRRPAIQLQLEQARLRLKSFAHSQAELAAKGWRIVYAEDDEVDQLTAGFRVDDEAITLEGRIDRIDFHEAQRKLRILDYKSADTALCPDKAHRKDQEWIDLQLPLYRHLWKAAATLPADCAVELGYINLPKTESETGLALAQWDEGMLTGADEIARAVIRQLRREVFEPITYPAPDFSEELAAICLDNAFSAPSLNDDDLGGPA
jgi:ATP-dependent helicase/nuclease subunit B